MFGQAFAAVPRRSRSVRSVFLLAIATAIVLGAHLVVVENISSLIAGGSLYARPDAIAMRVPMLDLPLEAKPLSATPTVAQANPVPRAAVRKAPRPLRHEVRLEAGAGDPPRASMPERMAPINEAVTHAVDSPLTAFRADVSGDGGDALPTYATQFPPSFSHVYELRRGAQRAKAMLHWSFAAAHYEVRLTASLPDGATGASTPLLEWISRGGFDTAGLAPVRFTDKRQRRGTQAANFQRSGDAEKTTVRYSGPSVEHDLPPGAQDRLSWMVQLAAIAQARGGSALVTGETIVMFVSGARGDADVWQFGIVGLQTIEIGETSLTALKLVREPRKHYDTHVEVWLDPGNSFLPARVRLATSRHTDALELVLQPQGVPR